jgi:hypothetical protein
VRSLAALALVTLSLPAGRSCTGWSLTTFAGSSSDNDLAGLTCLEMRCLFHRKEREQMQVCSLCRYNHEVLYTVLMYRRPEKLFGGGVIYLNLPIGVPV